MDRDFQHGSRHAERSGRGGEEEESFNEEMRYKGEKDSCARGARWEEEEYDENDNCDDDNYYDEVHEPLDPDEKKFYLSRLTA
eukprot:1540621-Rhodomonas_salina.1